MFLPSRTSKAFTLLELIVVIVILGILAAIAIPSFQKVVVKSQDSSAAETLKAVDREAHALAAFRGETTPSSDDYAEATSDLPASAASEGLHAAASWRLKVPATNPTTKTYTNVDPYTETEPVTIGVNEVHLAYSVDGQTSGLATVSESGNCVLLQSGTQVQTFTFGSLGASCTGTTAIAGTVVEAAPAPAPEPAPITNDFVSVGDQNGVFYRLGTNSGETAWSNPVTSGRVVGTLSSQHNADTGAAAGVNRTGTPLHTGSAAGQTAAFDLGKGTSLQINHYTFQQRTDHDAHLLRTWTLQGSSDGTTWDAIHSGDSSNYGTTARGQWISQPVTSATSYRHFRILMTGTDSNGLQYLVLNEVELYGALTLPVPVATLAPTGVAAEAFDAAASVTFTPVAEAGDTKVSEYRVYANGGTTAVASGPTTPIRVSGLTNGTTYTFTVKAYNGTLSPASAASNSVTPQLPPGTLLTFTSAGDTNGVFHHLGTSNGTTAFSNPVTSGRVLGTLSSQHNADTGAAQGTARAAAPVHTGSGPGQFAAYDLKAGTSLRLRHYTFQQRTDHDAHLLRTWTLQGSNDGTTWSSIHSGDSSNYGTTARGQWISQPVNADYSYQHFRILMTGTDSNGAQYLVFDEVELYGYLAG